MIHVTQKPSLRLMDKYSHAGLHVVVLTCIVWNVQSGVHLHCVAVARCASFIFLGFGGDSPAYLPDVAMTKHPIVAPTVRTLTAHKHLKNKLSRSPNAPSAGHCHWALSGALLAAALGEALHGHDWLPPRPAFCRLFVRVQIAHGKLAEECVACSSCFSRRRDPHLQSPHATVVNTPASRTESASDA